MLIIFVCFSVQDGRLQMAGIFVSWFTDYPWRLKQSLEYNKSLLNECIQYREVYLERQHWVILCNFVQKKRFSYFPKNGILFESGLLGRISAKLGRKKRVDHRLLSSVPYLCNQDSHCFDLLCSWRLVMPDFLLL